MLQYAQRKFRYKSPETFQQLKPNKRKCANKRDTAVAALMVFGSWQAEHEDFIFEICDTHPQKLAAFAGVR